MAAGRQQSSARDRDERGGGDPLSMASSLLLRAVPSVVADRATELSGVISRNAGKDRRFFNYPTALFPTAAADRGDHPIHRKPEKPKPEKPKPNHSAVTKKSSSERPGSGERANRPKSETDATPSTLPFFNFPSALFERGGGRSSSSSSSSASAPFTNTALDNRRATKRSDAMTNNTSEAELRLVQLEEAIEVIRTGLLVEKDGGGGGRDGDCERGSGSGGAAAEEQASPRPRRSEQQQRQRHAETVEAITQICLRLDAISIPRTEPALRAKRKVLLRWAEALEGGGSADGDAAAAADDDDASSIGAAATTGESATTSAEPIFAAATAAEDRFRTIEREIEALEDRLLLLLPPPPPQRASDSDGDTAFAGRGTAAIAAEPPPYASAAATAKTVPPTRAVVEELVTQICCKLDGVVLPTTSSDGGDHHHRDAAEATIVVAALKARRRTLLRRAEHLETILLGTTTNPVSTAATAKAEM